MTNRHHRPGRQGRLQPGIAGQRKSLTLPICHRTIGLVFFAMLSVLSSWVSADWSCRCCGKSYPVNPGHSTYEDNWIQSHRNACCSSPQTGGNNQPATGSSQSDLERQRLAEEERQRQLAAEATRRAEEERQREFARHKQEILNTLKGVSQAPMEVKTGSGSLPLKRSADAVDVKGDLGLKSTSNAFAALPSGLPQSVEASIPDTPAGNRVRKGLEAIQAHDWKVALAWFQDALNHQPGDAGLKRLVDLAQFAIKKQHQASSGKQADATKNDKDDKVPDLVRSDTVGFGLDETAAMVMAARKRADAAAQKYEAEHRGHINVREQVRVCQDAAWGKGFAKQELEKQFQEALSEWHKMHDNDPNRWRWLGTPEATADEVTLGAKG